MAKSKYGMISRLVWDGGDEVWIPEELGKPAANQMQGTAAERVSELSGRTCYDSLGRGRSTEDYHKHILDVGHGSVYEHFAMTVQLGNCDSTVLWPLINRPGIWVEADFMKLRVTFNPRAILDWNRWTKQLTYLADKPDFVGKPGSVGDRLSYWAELAFPQIVPPRKRSESVMTDYRNDTRVEPRTEQEKWISMFMCGSRGWCYDSETEVLTKEGWKPWPEVEGNECFATLNPSTGELQYQNATAVLHEPYHGKMYRLKSGTTDLLVTPEHRMFVKKHDTQAAKRGQQSWEFLSAKDLFGKRVHYKKNATWKGEMESSFEIPDVLVQATIRNQSGFCGSRSVVCSGKKVSRLVFSEFIGYWLAEGHLDHQADGGYFVLLSQHFDSPVWNDMIHCVESLGYRYSIKKTGARGSKGRQIRISGGKALYDLLQPISGSLNKAIPAFMKDWDSDCQMALIKAHLAGDGSFPARSLGEANTISRKLADDLQESALKAGWSARIRVVNRRGEPPRLLAGKLIRHNHISYVVSYANKRSSPLVNHNGKRDDAWVDYSGMIHCVTVPNGTLYIRRNGCPVWSGNSHEQVRHKFRTAVSQRSTRFVNEAESPWLDHPLVQEFFADVNVDDDIRKAAKGSVDLTKHHSRETYSLLSRQLQKWLEDRGVDPITARKQARGAARGYLGNALWTEMIFSASVAEWKWMMQLRCSSHADAEIRGIFCEALPELRSSRYGDDFKNLILVPAPDGLGQMAVERSGVQG